jgi:hypothetical protein
MHSVPLLEGFASDNHLLMILSIRGGREELVVQLCCIRNGSSV